MLTRKINAEDIALPSGYRIEAFITGLTTLISMAFTDKGDMLVADAGVTFGSGNDARDA